MTGLLDDEDVLLQQFVGWAESKDRDVDLVLMAALLGLREDDLEPTYWPAGSVEHLLLERWPSKGPTELPDPEAVVDTLDGWFRFLRATGQMSGRSAEVKALARETVRAASRMTDVAQDRGSWSAGKVMLDFGRSIGIDVELADEGSLQERLDQITEAWNALPVEERRRLMPNVNADGPLSLGKAGEPVPGDPDDLGDPHDDRGEAERLMEAYGAADPVIALLMSYRDRMPEGPLPPVELVAEQLAGASYVRQVLALARWAQDGRPLTKTGALRLTPSREAYAELGLDAWTRAQLDRSYFEIAGSDRLGRTREEWIEQQATRPWRSAHDCEALDRLVFGGIASGRLRIEGSKMYGDPSEPADAGEWLDVGFRALAGLIQRGLFERSTPIEVQALMASYVGGRAWVSKAELVEMALGWHHRPDPAISGERFWRVPVELALGRLADTGLVEETEEAVRLTEAGERFMPWWYALVQQQVRENMW